MDISDKFIPRTSGYDAADLSLSRPGCGEAGVGEEIMPTFLASSG